MNSWLKVFLLELQHRGYSTREMQELHKNIQPFIAYLEYVNQHGITGLEPEHVQVYVAKEKATLHTASTSHDILAINKRIAAVKMFCLQMVIAGKISYDYAISIDLLPLPAILAAHKKYPL